MGAAALHQRPRLLAWHFPDRDHFAQVAFADTHGRVFVGTDPNMDVQDMQARFMFGKESDSAGR